MNIRKKNELLAIKRQQEYEKRNLLGFEGDTFIGPEIQKLCDENDIEIIIETGTYLGGTTKKLSEIRPTISIENNEEFFNRASGFLPSSADVSLILGDSPSVLQNMLFPSAAEQRGTAPPKRVLFFLDAHWGEDWPVLKELDVIRKANLERVVIVIHDFKVPGKDFGFDSYGGQDLDFDFIKDHLPEGVKHYYNTNADGAKRGVIYIIGPDNSGSKSDTEPDTAPPKKKPGRPKKK